MTSHDPSAHTRYRKGDRSRAKRAGGRSAAFAAVSVAARTLVFGACVFTVDACRDPTQITLIVSTTAQCEDIGSTGVSVGELVSLEPLPATSSSTGCDRATGEIGSLVVVPSDANDGAVAFKVVTGLKQPADACAPPAYEGCIVSRRALRFSPARPLVVRVVQEIACADVPCDSLTTCKNGKCVSLECAEPGACDGDAGAPIDAGSPVDGAVVDGAVIDGAVVDGAVITPACPAGELSCGGACVAATDCVGCTGAPYLCGPTRRCVATCAGSCTELTGVGLPVQCFACNAAQLMPRGSCASVSASSFCLSGDYSAAYGGAAGAHCDCSDTLVANCPGESQVCKPKGATDWCVTCGEQGEPTNGLPCKGGGLCNAGASPPRCM